MIIYEEVLAAFQEQKVKYVVVGGLAVNLLGGLRTTADLDILVEMSDRNLAKIVTILKQQGYAVRQPVDPMGIADEKIRRDWIVNKNMKAFNFYKDKDFKQVDIIIESPVRFEDADKDALNVKIDQLKIPVISIKNLIRMKERAGRGIDRSDIQELKMIEKMRTRP